MLRCSMPAMLSRSRSVTSAFSLVVFKASPPSTLARSLRVRVANHGSTCTMRWRWRWIRARRCVAPIPFTPCLLYFHTPGRPSITQPSHTSLLSAAAASRSSPTRKRCAVDPAPAASSIKFRCTTARHTTAPPPSTHASHARCSPVDPTRPAQVDNPTYILQGLCA
ncbi:hypothetical protein B0H14DRAFT_2946999 [Mycena olivaceomarginata]|nr:hypothetical protein B0H14DRAFT_3020623 [Mycena olivaceomarginata]KAJ7788827.1 hypothetical protein B0H14DRAFT_2946999 [Mycena olivaceomarginata]